VHLGIDAGLPEQGLPQLRIIVLRPVRQRRDRRAVTPWIERRNDTASGPGSLAARLACLEQNHLLPRTRQQVSRKQAYDSAAHHYRHLSRHIPPPPAGSHIHAFSIDLSTRCSTTSLSFIAGPTATAAERKAHSPGWRHMISAKEPHHAEQGSRLYAC